jgi:hypothetical protein
LVVKHRIDGDIVRIGCGGFRRRGSGGSFGSFFVVVVFGGLLLDEVAGVRIGGELFE